MDNAKNTLETPVWGKLAKRGFYYGLSRKFTTAKNQKFLIEISSASFLTRSAKTTHQTRPAFLALKNQPLEIYCMLPKFILSLLPIMALVRPPLDTQEWPKTHPLPQLFALSFSCPSTLFLFSQMRMCLSPSALLFISLIHFFNRLLKASRNTLL
jgi:hypothetical protein